MVAAYEADQLLSVEQDRLLQEQQTIKDVFEEQIGWCAKK